MSTPAAIDLLKKSADVPRYRAAANAPAWIKAMSELALSNVGERLAKVIAGLNVLRSEEPDLLQGDPFAIGYFVGDGVTPNSVSEEAMNRFATRPDDREQILYTYSERTQAILRCSRLYVLR